MKAILLPELPGPAQNPAQFNGMEDGMYHYKGNVYTMCGGYACQVIGVLDIVDYDDKGTPDKEPDTIQETVNSNVLTSDTLLIKAMLIARGDKVDDIMKVLGNGNKLS